VLAAVDKWRDKADMVITCGWLSMYARPKLKETGTPQLFVPVLKSVAIQMLPSLHEPPETNLSGVYVMYPPEKILRLAHLILPALQRYGYVYDSRIPADTIFKLSYEQLSLRARHGITIHFFDLANGVEAVLSGLRQQRIEAYGGIVGSFKKRKELAESGLPVITAFTLDIEEQDLEEYVQEGNVVAGLYNPFRYCGEQAAEMTADIFLGLNTIEQTIPRPAKQIAFINMKTASRLHIYIPFSALEAVDVVMK
jgi:putative ABC transport system substrate-binding protein